MNPNPQRYTPEEILSIFKEQHRLCAELNMGEPDMEIKADMSINNWSDSMDLIGWRKLSAYLNKVWNINIPEQDWENVFYPGRKKKLIGMCKLIASEATKTVFQPKVSMNMECFSAGIFTQLKMNLSSRGVDVSELAPSSLIHPYLTEYTSEIIEEITHTGLSLIDEIEIRSKKKIKTTLWSKLNILSRYNYEVHFNNLITFRDLIESMMEQLKREYHTKCCITDIPS